jgi:pimeloyl-ACP methyl ester carboxylesterase
MFMLLESCARDAMKRITIEDPEIPCVFKSKDGHSQVMELYDGMLGQWPVEHELLEIPTRHGNTFVIASGDPGADTLILLHGAGSNSLMWIDDVQVYSKHYRVYAVDIIGEAGKSSANRPSWQGPAYEEWLADIYDGLKIDNASVIGISQGGWTALKFATARPERVDRLILICPGGIIYDNMPFVLHAFTLKTMGSWGIRRIVKKLFGDQPVEKSVLEAMILTIKNFKYRLAIPPLYANEELAALTMPTLFIGGTKDALRNSAKIADRLRRLVPNLTVDLIDGGGHAMNNTTCTILPFLLTGKHPDLRN